MQLAPETQEEIRHHLEHIKNLTREYPLQAEHERKLVFASIRIAAESIGTLVDDELSANIAGDIRRQTLTITEALDDLAARFGSDAADHCGACGARLTSTVLSTSTTLKYCSVCPRPILDAVREISDLTGADAL